MARKPRTTPARRAAPAAAAPETPAAAAPIPEKPADELQAPVAAEGAEAAVVSTAPPAAGVAEPAAAAAVTDVHVDAAGGDAMAAPVKDVYAAAAEVMAEEVEGGSPDQVITIVWPTSLGPSETLSARIQQAIADAIANMTDPEGLLDDRRYFGASQTEPLPPLPPVGEWTDLRAGTTNGEPLIHSIPGTEVEEWTAPPPPYVVAGMPVMFREQNRRFNGLPTTPAIVTRVYPDMVVNLMVLPDGGEPYPRMAVGYEETLDPEAIGRAWTHIQF